MDLPIPTHSCHTAERMHTVPNLFSSANDDTHLHPTVNEWAWQVDQSQNLAGHITLRTEAQVWANGFVISTAKG